MTATITAEGQITLPVALCERLGLEAGDVLEFDESVPYIRARKPVERKPVDIARMRSTLGRGRELLAGRTSAEWIEYLRGPVE